MHLVSFCSMIVSTPNKSKLLGKPEVISEHSFISFCGSHVQIRYLMVGVGIGVTTVGVGRARG